MTVHALKLRAEQQFGEHLAVSRGASGQSTGMAWAAWDLPLLIDAAQEHELTIAEVEHVQDLLSEA